MNREGLKTLIRIRGVRRVPPRRPAPPASPDSIRLAYFKRLREGPVATIRELVEKRLVPALARIASKGNAKGKARTDAGEDDEIGNILDELGEAYANRWNRRNAGHLAEAIAGDLDRVQAHQTNEVLREHLGVDVVGNEPWLADVIGQFTRENVALIKSLGSQTFDQIEGLITREAADGERWEEIATKMRERLDVTERRANLIARDQVGKLYGDLNRVRQTDLGIGGYVWRTMRDNRVRDNHESRDGRHYTWDEPPAGGHPGEAVLCRCYAEPDLAPLLAELGVDTSDLDLTENDAGPTSSKRLGPSLQEIEPTYYRRPRFEPEERKPAAPVVSPVVAKAREVEAKSAQVARERLAAELTRDIRDVEAIRKEAAKLRKTEAKAEKIAAEAQEKLDAAKREMFEARERADELRSRWISSGRDPEIGAAYKAADKAATRAEGAFDRARVARDAKRELWWGSTNSALTKEYEATQADAHNAAAAPRAAARRAEYEQIEAEGKGPVRGAASAEVAREFPEIAEILGGRLKVEVLDANARRQLETLAKVPPNMLAALKPHMAEIHIVPGDNGVQGGGRFSNLTHKVAKPGVDDRASWAEVEGVATPYAGTGRIEVVVASSPRRDVMVHELSHALDGVVGNNGGKSARSDWDGKGIASDRPEWREAWKSFTEGKGLDISRPTHVRRTYFTDPDQGPCETFAEAHARYIYPIDDEGEGGYIDSVRRLFPEDTAGKSDGWVATANRFGPKIADLVEDRIVNERWFEP